MVMTNMSKKYSSGRRFIFRNDLLQNPCLRIFHRCINPNLIRVADYAHHITTVQTCSFPQFTAVECCCEPSISKISRLIQCNSVSDTAFLAQVSVPVVIEQHIVHVIFSETHNFYHNTISTELSIIKPYRLI